MSTYTERIQWRPVAELDCYLAAVREMVLRSRKELERFRKAGIPLRGRKKLARAKHERAERLDQISLYREQVCRWRRGGLTGVQSRTAEEVGLLLDEEELLTQEILEIVREGP